MYEHRPPGSVRTVKTSVLRYYYYYNNNYNNLVLPKVAISFSVSDASLACQWFTNFAMGHCMYRKPPNISPPREAKRH